MPVDITAEDYLRNHKASKIRVGDRVTVFRTAEDDENGWRNSWPSEMNNAVGQTGIVTRDNNTGGFLLKFPYNEDISDLGYPYFVLKIVR